MVAYGINIGVFAAVGTFLNQFVLQYFPVNTFRNCEIQFSTQTLAGYGIYQFVENRRDVLS